MTPPFLEFFAFPKVIEDLLRGFIMRDNPLADNLDYDRMERVPDDWVPDGPRYADIVWSVPFLAGAYEGFDSPTHIIFIIKFVSEVIEDIGDHLGRHAASLHREIHRRGAFGAPVKPPVIAPIVVYNGRQPWDAPGGVPV